MSWLYELFQTYENCDSEVGKIVENRPVLLPIAHSTQNAQIEITLNESGGFVRAEEIPKEDAVTIIPVTEDSGSRSSGIAPHPLADYLEYIAKDYGVYQPDAKKQKNEEYLKLLEEWASSRYGVPQVNAVYQYAVRGSIVNDLLCAGILEAEGGKLTKKKISGYPQEKAFVRFAVESREELESRLYKSKKVFESYSRFYVSRQDTTSLCYITGEIIPCSDKHPAKIRHTADKAKLISANDTAGFTYRGRLVNSAQTSAVGYEVSQKAHNALRWLIEKQGVRAGEQVILAWSIGKAEIENPFQELGVIEEERKTFTGEGFVEELRKTIYGQYEDIQDRDKIIIMSVEAATTGRLSIPYYLSIHKEIFINSLLHWHHTCCWRMHYKKYDNPFFGTPSMIELAYAIAGDKNDKLRKQVMERLVLCIVERQKLPQDMVNAAVMRAQNPFTYTGYGEWRRAISISCALIRKEYYDRKKEEWDVALDEKNADRSYLFGRLLATGEMLEKRALSMQSITRNTSAERFFQQFSKKPVQTWKTIYDNLRPYIMKLNSSGKTFYVKQINSIINQFEESDFVKKESLNHLFLLGYCCQMEAYENYKKPEEKEIEE